MEIFYMCLMVILIGIPLLGVMLYFLISLFLYMDKIEEEKQRELNDMELENEKPTSHDVKREN